MEIDQLSVDLWVWSRPVDFRHGFSLQGFCTLFIILSQFLTKDVLERIVNPTYFIGCYDSNLSTLSSRLLHWYLVQPTRQDVANIGTACGDIIYDVWNWDLLTIHFLDRTSWEVLYKSPFYLERDAPATTFASLFILVLLILFLVLCLWYLHYVIFLFQ